MLDIMQTPPFVTEHITWRATRQELPDCDTTVHVYTPDCDGEQVWLGYYDGAKEGWFNIDHLRISQAVTWWAPMLEGPAEPKPADVASHYLRNLQALINKATTHGLVLTVEQLPLTPLAQGNYETVASVRPAIRR